MLLDKKRKFFLLASLFFSLVVILSLFEIGSYYILVVKRKSVYLQPDLNKIDSNEIKEGISQVFSYDLGWEPSSSGNFRFYRISYCSTFGYRGPCKPIENALICLFGDSFAVGSKDIEKSWAYLLEQKINKPVLNFGVGGYGTDQAYWRFEKRYVDKIRTPYVCLVVMSENIARVVNRYWGFYARSSSLLTPKPMYHKTNNEDIVLLPNPIKTPHEITLLKNMKFLKEMGQKDYWYNHYEKYDFNQKVHFPYSLFFMKQLPFSMKKYYEKRIKYNDDYKILYTNESALAIMEYIIFKFINRAKDNDTFPIILFLPNWKDFVDYQKRGETVYHNFYLHLKSRHDTIFDGLEYFIPHLEKGEEISSFFISFKDGHPNPYGERVISEGFYRCLQALDKERHFFQ